MNGQITADALYKREDSTEWLPLRESPILAAGELDAPISLPSSLLSSIYNLFPDAKKAIQKKVLMAGLAVMLLMGLFPPWLKSSFTSSFDARSMSLAHEEPGQPSGRHFILFPPKPAKAHDVSRWGTVGPQHLGTVRIDFGRLLVELMLAALATAVAVGFAGLRKRQKPTE